jgi:hypothetical protein
VKHKYVMEIFAQMNEKLRSGVENYTKKPSHVDKAMAHTAVRGKVRNGLPQKKPAVYAQVRSQQGEVDGHYPQRYESADGDDGPLPMKAELVADADKQLARQEPGTPYNIGAMQ